MSPETSRNPDDTTSLEESTAAKKPKLRSIEGGGETTPKKTGHLKEVKEAAKDAHTAVKDVRSKIEKRLGWSFAEEPVEELPMWKTPPYILRDMTHGTVTNLIRRKWEVSAPAVKAMGAGFQTLWQPLRHPLKTLIRPDKYMLHPLKATTSMIRAYKNFGVKTPTKGPWELYKGVIQNPVERINHKVAKIPAVGKVLSTTTNAVAKTVGWPLHKFNNLGERIGSPFDRADDWVTQKRQQHTKAA